MLNKTISRRDEFEDCRVEGINRTLVLSKTDFDKSVTLTNKYRTPDNRGPGPARKKVTAGCITVDARLLPGDKGCFMKGDRKLREEEKRISEWGSSKEERQHWQIPE